MKYGFFGGCFNPPTIAHYNLIKQALIQYNFDKVYFVPMNNYYPKPGLIDMNHRINMLEKLCLKDKNISVLDIEKKINKRCTALEIFRIIEQKYPNDEIVFFMGEDNYIKMKDWGDYTELQKYNYIVFQRDDRKDSNITKENVIYMKNSENLKISSTIIRNRLKKHESIDEFVTYDIKNYIIENNLYMV